MEVGDDRRGGGWGGVRRRRGGRGPSGSTRDGGCSCLGATEGSRSGVSAPDPDRARAGERGGGAWGEGVGRLGFGRGGVGGYVAGAAGPMGRPKGGGELGQARGQVGWGNWLGQGVFPSLSLFFSSFFSFINFLFCF